MDNSLASIALLVRDYDEALAFYVDILGFHVLEDTNMGSGKRWVVVAPAGGLGCSLVIARAKNSDEELRIGDQTGGRVFLFLETSDFRTMYQKLQNAGVEFCETPRQEPFGTVVVFKDLYGNKIDLIQRNQT